MLGPLQVMTERGLTVMERPKERAVLATLALSAGSVVHETRLVDALWGAHPPRTAAKTLQNHVLRLRQLLGSATVVTQAGGYRLGAEPEAVDAVCFERAVRRVTSIGEEPARRAAALRSVLASWRGTPYADLPGWAPAEAEARRLEEFRLLAEELQVEAELACGHHAVALIQLEAMVALEPLREHRWELLMVALYREGRQADALRAFTRARDMLGAELGLAPGPSLAALERAVLRQDPMLDLPGADAPEDEVASRRRAIAAMDRADAAARSVLMTQLGEALRAGGDPDYAATLLEASAEAREAADEDQAVRATLATTRRGGMGAHAGGQDRARVTALEAALTVATDPASQARVLASLAAEVTYTAPIARRRALTDEALAIARELDDAGLLIDVLLRRAAALADPDSTTERCAETEECLHLAGQGDDPLRLWAAGCARSTVALRAGRTGEADRALSLAQLAVTDLATPGMRYVLMVRIAARELLAGRLLAAERAADEALELGIATGQPEVADVYGTQLLHLRFEQGRLGEMGDTILALDLDRPHPLPCPVVAWSCALLGHRHRAEEALARAVAAAPVLADDEFRLVALGYAALAAAVLGDGATAEVLAPLLEPYAEQFGNTGAVVMPVTAHLLALLAAVRGEMPSAQRYFQQAEAAYGAADAPAYRDRLRADRERCLP